MFTQPRVGPVLKRPLSDDEMAALAVRLRAVREYKQNAALGVQTWLEDELLPRVLREAVLTMNQAIAIVACLFLAGIGVGAILARALLSVP